MTESTISSILVWILYHQRVETQHCADILDTTCASGSFQRPHLRTPAQSTGGRTLCSAAPAAEELLLECVTEIPRIRSMHITSASLSFPDALTRRDLRRCAFFRFLRKTFRSSRMSRARLRKLAIWSAS